MRKQAQRAPGVCRQSNFCREQQVASSCLRCHLWRPSLQVCQPLQRLWISEAEVVIACPHHSSNRHCSCFIQYLAALMSPCQLQKYLQQVGLLAYMRLPATGCAARLSSCPCALCTASNSSSCVLEAAAAAATWVCWMNMAVPEGSYGHLRLAQWQCCSGCMHLLLLLCASRHTRRCSQLAQCG